MSTLWTFLAKNLLCGVFMGMLVILLLRIGGISVLALAQSCGQWSVVSSPNVGTTSNELYGVAVISSNDVWAVGGLYDPSTGQGSTLIEHWNGSQWSSVSSPSLGTFSLLTAVTAISSKNAWAVGYYSQGQSSPQTLIEHWNGKKWRIAQSPVQGGQLYGVVAISQKDIWAVGTTANGQTLTEHWNGKSWSVISSPTPCQGSNLSAVTASATNDVWAVGTACYTTLTEHWDGTQWSIIPSPNPMPDANLLYAVTAISPNDVWAVGNGKDTIPPLVPITEHWDGTSWTAVPAPTQKHNSGLIGLAAASTNNIWAVGYYFVSPQKGYLPLTYHWDGTSWNSLPNPSTGNSLLNAVAVTPAGDFWAVGYQVPRGQTSQTLTEFYC